MVLSYLPFTEFVQDVLIDALNTHPPMIYLLIAQNDAKKELLVGFQVMD